MLFLVGVITWHYWPRTKAPLPPVVSPAHAAPVTPAKPPSSPNVRAPRKRKAPPAKPSVFLFVASRGGPPPAYVRLVPNSMVSTVLDANTAIHQKTMAFLLRDTGTAPIIDPRITARVGDPNKLVCVDFPLFSLRAVGAPINPCDSSHIGPLPDVPVNPDTSLRQEEGDFPIWVVYGEPHKAKYFNMELDISAGNVPYTRYPVQVQYYGLYP